MLMHQKAFTCFYTQKTKNRTTFNTEFDNVDLSAVISKSVVCHMYAHS